jgi:hypothetical protein
VTEYFGKTGIEWLCIFAGVGFLMFLVHLIRERRLREEYALLWLLASASIIGMAMERRILHAVARALGVYYPPIVLAVVAGFFGMLLSIHFSLVISRLSDQNRVLAQEVALLKLELEGLKRQACEAKEP